MENVVNKIIEIDREADNRLNMALENKKKLIDSACVEAEKIKKKLLDEADARIAEVEAERRAESDSKISKLRADSEARLKAMDEAFENKRDIIEQSIYMRTVGE